MKLQQRGLMKVWKSPVFHFGILLAVAVVGLLLAPFVIDWNGYRADLEAYGRKLTGREVRIDGDVSARLFPWPRLTAERIAIANPPGLSENPLATAERLTVHMTLAGLVRGGLDVQSIEVERPVIDLDRPVSGEANWQLTPSADLLRSDALSRVRLDQISFANGTVHFRDRRRGETVTLENLNAELASPGVAGPWRVRAKGLYEGHALDIGINTASYKEGDPFRFGVSLAAADGSGYVLAFDGAMNQGKAEGGLRIAPAQAEDGRSDAEGRVRPLAFTAKVKGDFEKIDFDSIEVTRLEPGENGTVATGTGALKLGSHITASLDLTSAVLDLDQLAGYESRTLLRSAGGLALPGSLLALLPADTSLDAAIAVTALKSGGQTLDNMRLAIAADQGMLRINRFSAGLPGRSEVLFKGSYLSEAGGPEISGQLSLETSDLREFAFWLSPEARQRLGALWSGDRGRLKMETGVSRTASKLTFTNTEFELDGERGSGSLAYNANGNGAISLSLESRRFDLDAYAPQGIPTLSVVAQGGLGALIPSLMPRPDAPDVKLTFKAGEVQLNGVTAQGVDLDLQADPTRLNLSALDIASVGGTKVSANGLILNTGKGASGNLSLNVDADDPAGFVRLLGLGGGSALPPWAQGLGKTSVAASLTVRPAAQGSEVLVTASGNAGELGISGQALAAPDQTVSGKLSVTAPNSGRILALLGFTPLEPDTAPGALSLEAAGTASEGFLSTATLQAHGARLDYRGQVQPWADGYGLDGQVTARAADAAALIAATGMPTAPLPGQLDATARLAWGEGRWTLSGIEGTLGAAPFSGTASLTPDRVADVQLATGPLRLSDLLAATFLDWTGPAPDLEASFATALPLGLTGEMRITPSTLALHPHFTAEDAVIGIAAKAGELRLTMSGKDAAGRAAQVELASAGTETGRRITGMASIPVDLRQQMAMINGMPVAEGAGLVELRFASEGRSPAAALAAVKGEGRYAFDDFTLLGVTPSAFTTALAQAKDAAGVTAAFDALRGGAGMRFGPVSGKIAIAEGQVTFDPVTRREAEADVSVKTVAELALGQIDLDIGLAFTSRDGLPPMSIAYAGPPAALARAEDNTELATALGVTIMQQGIDELERLQQEQARLAKQEEQQRIEDEARLQAYYAQRDELLLRRRELKVQAEMQVREADRLRRQIEAERALAAEINKIETRQRQRELRVWRRMARLAETPAPAAQPEPEVVRKPLTTVAEPPPRPKPPAPRPQLPAPQTAQDNVLSVSPSQ